MPELLSPPLQPPSARLPTCLPDGLCVPQALLVIFWLVFTIMGMHIFGGLELQSIWPNYDTFFNSLISTFNVSRRTLL